jgi:DNA-binding transcriptional MerR regulator
MNVTEKSYSLDELCVLVELPKRSVRFYIQKGLVERPIGETRSAYYTTQHLEQLLTIRKWQQAGISLERISELLRDPQQDRPPPKRRGPGSVEVWSHLVIADGVELHIEPGQAGLKSEDVRELFRRMMGVYEEIKSGGNNNEK